MANKYLFSEPERRGTGSCSLRMKYRVFLSTADVTLLNSLDLWGQQQPDQGVVRFFTEDKNFRISFNASNARISVNIHKIPTLAHCKKLCLVPP